MSKCKRTSNAAKFLMLYGIRPSELWTRIAILTQIKRVMPECYSLAKQLPIELLQECISPLVHSMCHFLGKVVPFYAFSKYRAYQAFGMTWEAKCFKRTHNGKDYDAHELFEANEPLKHKV